MKFIPLGGGHRIGASANYLEMDGFHCLIDAGVHPGPRRARVDFDGLVRLAGLRRAADLDAIFITHAHRDHIGGLLHLLARAPEVPVFFHPFTGTIARGFLGNLPGINDHFGVGRGFRRFLEACAENQASVYGSRRTISGDGASLDVTFLEAGHIPGSLSFRFQGARSSVLFTGDFNHRSSPFLLGTSDNPAFEGLEPELLVADGTYAGRLPAVGPGVIGASELAAKVNAVLERLGTAMVTTAPAGRAQKVVALLAKAVREGRSPPLPIWCDERSRYGLRSYQRLFPEQAELLELEGPYFKAVDSGAPNMPPASEPAVVLLGGGFRALGSGWAESFLIRALSDARNGIFLTGHQAPGSLGTTLETVARSGRQPDLLHFGGRKVRSRAEILSCKLSAHADHEGIVEHVRSVRPERVVLVHRNEDPGAMERFSEAISPTPIVLPKNGEVVRFP